MTINGLPTGIEAVRVGMAMPDEYIFENRIHKVSAFSQRSGLVVKAAPGYTIHYEPKTDEYLPIKAFDKPQYVTLIVRVTDPFQESSLDTTTQLPNGIEIVKRQTVTD